ncbi:MAG: 4a-hydroxytetrahydrobiopterin dehydratase [Caldilineales bacterium]|nr:4a-hydroxytetrahydrobiopterin dehydratase [Caldilineales bacterium]MDW8317223.1 4a-hydroxytetrahydrobiopterin dehydratase [Anaerolineae bacterium]
MNERLTQAQIDQALASLSGWSQQGNAIVRTFTLRSFPAALAFAAAVGHLAERADHHPDILIQYKRVTLTLSTHSAGGLTVKDFALAREIDAIA